MNINEASVRNILVTSRYYLVTFIRQQKRLAKQQCVYTKLCSWESKNMQLFTSMITTGNCSPPQKKNWAVEKLLENFPVVGKYKMWNQNPSFWANLGGQLKVSESFPPKMQNLEQKTYILETFENKISFVTHDDAADLRSFVKISVFDKTALEPFAQIWPSGFLIEHRPHFGNLHVFAVRVQKHWRFSKWIINCTSRVVFTW